MNNDVFCHYNCPHSNKSTGQGGSRLMHWSQCKCFVHATTDPYAPRPFGVGDGAFLQLPIRKPDPDPACYGAGLRPVNCARKRALIDICKACGYDNSAIVLAGGAVYSRAKRRVLYAPGDPIPDPFPAKVQNCACARCAAP